MKRFRLVGLVLTLAAVALLAGSLFAGLGRGGSAPAPPRSEEAQAVPAERVRVEVLNAAGVPGLARAATERLRERGFDVVYYGNAGSAAGGDTSRVLDRLGKRDVAHRVAEAIGVASVAAAPDTTLYVDVTVVLGRDWAEARAAALPR
jgi:hypothetical protein